MSKAATVRIIFGAVRPPVRRLERLWLAMNCSDAAGLSRAEGHGRPSTTRQQEGGDRWPTELITARPVCPDRQIIEIGNRVNGIDQ